MQTSWEVNTVMGRTCTASCPKGGRRKKKEGGTEMRGADALRYAARIALTDKVPRFAARCRFGGS